MSWIALFRHGITDWNERGLIQGRTDILLSAGGIAKLQQARPGDDFLQAYWVSSPLQRATQTATILNPHATIEIHPALNETNWGHWEGLHRAEIPQRIQALPPNLRHGLDFTPPHGESPRMVRQRIVHWCKEVTKRHPKVIAVTHKGVIRGALSAACEWDMSEDFQSKPDWSLPHIFHLNTDGKLELVRLNCPWERSPSVL